MSARKRLSADELNLIELVRTGKITAQQVQDLADGKQAEESPFASLPLDRIEKLAPIIRSAPDSYIDLVVSEETQKLAQIANKSEKAAESSKLNAAAMKQQLKDLREKLELERRKNEVYEALKESRIASIPTIKTPISGSGSVSQACVLLSDWHIGEKWDASTTSGLSFCSKEALEDRIVNFLFPNALRLVNTCRHDTTIEQLNLFVLGDMITGWIHDEQVRSTDLSPTEQARMARALLIAGINYMIEHGNFKQINVFCVDGNHDRMFKKKSSSNRQAESLGSLVYLDLAMHFKDHPLVNVVVPKSIDGLVSMFDERYLIRYTHGDAFAFSGGNGLSRHYTAVLKGIQGMGHGIAELQADQTLLGHFHTYTAGQNFMVNGSVCGLTPWAYSGGFSLEKPMQSFFLIEETRGRTLCAPIHCVDPATYQQTLDQGRQYFQVGKP